MTQYVDYIVIGVFLAICMGIGIFHGCKGKKRQTLEYYLLGNRHIHIFPVAISFFITYQSAISLMGVPADIYNYGTMFMWVYITFTGSLFVSCFTIVPLVHPLGITSAFEYLEMRFKSRAVRLLGTSFSMLQTTLYMGITLYAPALAIEAVAKIPLWASIVLAGGVGIIYTAIGGIKSVVWTDAFQCFIVFGGTIAALIKGFVEIGSPERFASAIEEGKRVQYADWNFDPRVRHTTWGVLIGSFFIFLPNWCNQSSVQRISSLRTERLAKLSFLLSMPCVLVYGALLILLGLVLFAYYRINECDPLKAGYINNANQLMPYFVFDVMKSYPGIPGVYISALFSGSLSTVSSGINSLAANTVEDLLKNRLLKFNKFQMTLVAKIAVLFYGGLAIAVAYAAQSMSGPVTQIAMVAFGACGGPVSGLFFLGGIFPFANWKGAFVGGILAIIINLWISVGTTLYGAKAPKLPPNPITGCVAEGIFNMNITSINNTLVDLSSNSSLELSTPAFIEDMYTTGNAPVSSGPIPSDFFLYNISYVWYGMIGFSLTIIFGIIISCLTGRDETDAKYLFPCCRRFSKQYSSSSMEKSTPEKNDVKLLEIKELLETKDIIVKLQNDDIKNSQNF